MGARQKLNWGYFNGSLLLAALAGGLLQSWLAFALTLAVLIILNVFAGEIRPAPRNARGPDRP